LAAVSSADQEPPAGRLRTVPQLGQEAICAVAALVYSTAVSQIGQGSEEDSIGMPGSCMITAKLDAI
jgi:hypothetical protein